MQKRRARVAMTDPLGHRFVKVASLQNAIASSRAEVIQHFLAAVDLK